jgi:predicted ATPase
VGKFDQMQQSKPFSAIATAFDSFIDVMIRSRYELVISNLQIAIGEDEHHLMNVIPTLSSIINGNASQITAASSLINTNAQNLVQLLHHLFCRFVEIITANVQVSLTLCLEMTFSGLIALQLTY